MSQAGHVEGSRNPIGGTPTPNHQSHLAVVLGLCGGQSRALRSLSPVLTITFHQVSAVCAPSLIEITCLEFFSIPSSTFYSRMTINYRIPNIQ